MRAQLSDDELIERTAAGDRESFDVLVERHGPGVLRLVRAMSRGDDAAADIVQEALLDAFRGAGTFRKELGTVRTWLFAIARNAARRARGLANDTQALDRGVSLAQLAVDAGWGGPDPASAIEQRDLLARAISSLSPADREVIVLCDVEGVSGAEAAGLMSVELSALKSRLHRARLRLLAAVQASDRIADGLSDRVVELSCGDVLDRLADYVSGELEARARAGVDAHLRACIRCETFGGRYAALVKAVRARGLPAPPLDERRRERIREGIRRA